MDKSMVFVVGAGASCDAGLPTGMQLMQGIEAALNFKMNDFGDRTSGGSEMIWSAMNQASNGSKHEFGFYRRASQSIKKSMAQAESIDNFIESRRNDPNIAFVGKLAIANCISTGERNSKLWVDTSNIYNTMNFGLIVDTWYAAFFRVLVSGCTGVAGVRERLKRIAFITFNYDRCIEHYLHNALMNYFEIKSEEAAEVMKELAIFHAYGHLGPLPWQDGGEKVMFGELKGRDQLRAVAVNLKTFTEGTDAAHSDIIAIRKIMQSAERVVYLGFSFNKQNLELLYGTPKAKRIKPRKIYGTAHGMSESDVVDVVTKQLKHFGKDMSSDFALRRGLLCDGLLGEYKRSFAFN